MASKYGNHQYKPNSLFRYDCENKQHYLLDEASGKHYKVDSMGNKPTKFIGNKTGFMGFNERQELAKTVSLSMIISRFSTLK